MVTVMRQDPSDGLGSHRDTPVCLCRSAEVGAVDVMDGIQLGPALPTFHFLSLTVGQRDRLRWRCVTFSVHLSRHASVDSLLYAGCDVGPPAPNSQPLLTVFHVQQFSQDHGTSARTPHLFLSPLSGQEHSTNHSKVIH